MMAYEIPRPGAESTCPDHQAVADVDSESTKGYPAAKKNRTKPKHMLKSGRRRSGKPARDTRPDINSLITELRQINTHLGQLLDQKKRHEGDEAHMLRGTWAKVPCAPVTSTELYSGSCLLHGEWYSGFDTSNIRDLKTYFLAIAGAEWHSVISPMICRDFFHFRGNHTQVDDRLEIIDYSKRRSLGAWDQRALSASESIVQLSAEEPYRNEWKTRRNLGELREVIDADWSEGLLSSRGTVFYLHTRPLSFNDHNFDALVFIEADIAYPELRCLRVSHNALVDEDIYDNLYEYFRPEDDSRPVIGHIWYVLTILAIIQVNSLPICRNFDQICNGARRGSDNTSVFSFASIALILAIFETIFFRGEGPAIGRKGPILHPSMTFEAFHFLRSFCGKWPESRTIRTLSDVLGSLSPLTSIQMHIRFLQFADVPEVSYPNQQKCCRRSGLRIVREHHFLAASLPSEKGKQHSLLEHRMSFAFHGLIDLNHPPVFTLVALHDIGCRDLEIFDDYEVEGKPLHVECSGRAAGLCVFQGMVWAAVEKWQSGWSDVLDLLDNELSVSVSFSNFSINSDFHSRTRQSPDFWGRVWTSWFCDLKSADME